jgi:hypothetical protein
MGRAAESKTKLDIGHVREARFKKLGYQKRVSIRLTRVKQAIHVSEL